MTEFLSGIRVHKVILSQWDELLEEMYGNEQSLKNEIVKAVIEDSHVSSDAKKWLRNLSKG